MGRAHHCRSTPGAWLHQAQVRPVQLGTRQQEGSPASHLPAVQAEGRVHRHRVWCQWALLPALALQLPTLRIPGDQLACQAAWGWVPLSPTHSPASGPSAPVLTSVYKARSCPLHPFRSCRGRFRPRSPGGNRPQVLGGSLEKQGRGWGLGCPRPQFSPYAPPPPPPIFPRVENSSDPRVGTGARARVPSHQVPRAAGTAARAWDTRRPGSSHGRQRRASHPVGKCLGDSGERRPCRTRGGHSLPQPDGRARPPASAVQVTAWRESDRDTEDGGQ